MRVVDEPKIIIFHGYTSSCANARYQNLPFETIRVDVDHDSYSWQQTHDIYENLIREAMESSDSSLILLGHSLGGWWARYFVKKFDLRAVLLNPLVDVATSEVNMRDRNLYADHQADLEKWHGGRIIYYIELPDDVINFASVMPCLKKDGAVIIREGGHHRIRWPEIIPELLRDAVSQADQE